MEEQQPAKLVVHALDGTAVQSLDDINIRGADIVEWPNLVLAIFK